MGFNKNVDSLDAGYMRQALRLGRKGLGRTSPNPAVGAVVVRQGRVAGRGWHRRAGQDHAEVVALRQAGALARGADLYVTLEPCNHHGKTPPCTEAIISSGVRRVVVGTRDPNPSVSGGGVERLREAGIEVVVGVEESRCRRLIEAFTTSVSESRCHVTMKAALTLDGHIATSMGDAFWVSGPRTLAMAHKLRNELDVLVLGAGTLRKDDPQGTCRLRRGRDPMRLVVSRGFDVPLDARFFTARSGKRRARVVLAVPETARGDSGGLEDLNVEIWRLPQENGLVSVSALCQRLWKEGMTSVLLEGGAALNGAFWDAKLVDRIVFVVAPKIIGGQDAVPVIGGQGMERMADAVGLLDLKVRRMGSDLVVEGRPDWRGTGSTVVRQADRVPPRVSPPDRG